MLQELSVKQLERALRYLHNQPTSFPPPQELEKLNEMEWFLLDRMLQALLKEKEQSPLQ
jgi:hypothetical protein